MNGQTRRGSLIEAVVNVAIGFGVNFAANLVVLPLVFGIEVGLAANLLVGTLYTFISIARQYVIRRWFEARIKRAIYGQDSG